VGERPDRRGVIHYDERYAREVEGYPDRVVHGPLISLVMADFAERCSGRQLARWSFRATAPLFCGGAGHVYSRRDH
jgi:3-methylfumaryl-CoA hydratase